MKSSSTSCPPYDFSLTFFVFEGHQYGMLGNDVSEKSKAKADLKAIRRQRVLAGLGELNVMSEANVMLILMPCLNEAA